MHNGGHSLILSDHDNTLVVRWVVRERGVVLAGPDPATLIDPVSAINLRKEMLAMLQRWQEILADPNEWNNRFFQTFIVLHYCRMLHDLRNGYPGSKLAGAEWAKANLDPSWAGLIDGTWARAPHSRAPCASLPIPPTSRQRWSSSVISLPESEAYARASGLA